jgi:hypothetical protein
VSTFLNTCLWIVHKTGNIINVQSLFKTKCRFEFEVAINKSVSVEVWRENGIRMVREVNVSCTGSGKSKKWHARKLDVSHKLKDRIEHWKTKTKNKTVKMIYVYTYVNQLSSTMADDNTVCSASQLPSMSNLTECDVLSSHEAYNISAVHLFHAHSVFWPITVATRSKAWTVFAPSNTEIIGSNPTGGMDVYVVLCVGRGLVPHPRPNRRAVEPNKKNIPCYRVMKLVEMIFSVVLYAFSTL